MLSVTIRMLVERKLGAKVKLLNDPVGGSLPGWFLYLSFSFFFSLKRSNKLKIEDCWRCDWLARRKLFISWIIQCFCRFSTLCGWILGLWYHKFVSDLGFLMASKEESNIDNATFSEMLMIFFFFNFPQYAWKKVPITRAFPAFFFFFFLTSNTLFCFLPREERRETEIEEEPVGNCQERRWQARKTAGGGDNKNYILLKSKMR